MLINKIISMMSQEEVTRELHSIYDELQQEYLSFVEKAMVNLAMDKLPSEQWQLLKQDLTDNNKLRLDEFKSKFASIVLRFMQLINERIFGNHPYHNIHSLQNTSDLLQKSFFSLQDECVARHPILVSLVLNVNDHVKMFFFHRRSKLEAILQARSAFKAAQLKEVPKRDEPKKASLIDLEIPEPGEVATVKKAALPPTKVADFSRCLCNVLLKAAQHPSRTIECLMCLSMFHISCVKVAKQDLPCYVCAYCTIQNIDLFSPVQEVLCPPVFFQIQQPTPAKNFQFYIKDLPKNCQIQFRCLRVDENHGLDEPTWPDYGEILVNGVRLFDFKPLAQNTSLKKRKDSVYVLREKVNVTGQANFVTLRELKPTAQEQGQLRIASQQTYMAGIFLVQVQTSDALVKKLKKDRSLWMSVDQGKEMIREKQNELAANVDGIQVDKLKVSIACPFTMQRIETPARGHLCTHVQCFSLENMVKMTFNSAHRKWRCPICKRKCFKIYLDDYQLQVIVKMKALNLKDNDVTFRENGEIDDQQLQQSQSSQQTQDDPPSPKAKPVPMPVILAKKGEIVIDEDEVVDQVVKKVKVHNNNNSSTNQIILIDD